MENVGMYTVQPSGAILGCRIEGLDLSQSLGEKELGFILRCLADYAPADEAYAHHRRDGAADHDDEDKAPQEPGSECEPHAVAMISWCLAGSKFARRQGLSKGS